MPLNVFRHRRGTTLIELIIFVALLGIVMSAIMPLLFMAAEDRLLQQTISLVEHNGTQVLQNTTYRIRNAERILSPAMGQTGTVLALQTGSGTTNPTIIGVYSGALMIIEKTTQQTVSSSQVGLYGFIVRNTSTSATHQSVEMSFYISRTTRLQQPHAYTQFFDTNIALFQDDFAQGTQSLCAAPFCSPTNTYNWQFYDAVSDSCLQASTPLTCQ